ncbi:MAG: polysaccharide pyruvyl transferase WcaK-like protein [Phenylobacterium sp.]|jgi:polysaccharide pyruvyl transferase WcaK-like protein
MNIEIKGVEFSNKGAELMLHSIIQVLNRELGQYRLVLSPGHLLPYEKRARLGAWQKFSFTLFGINWTWLGNLLPGAVRRLLGHFGIMVEKEIDVVFDASGFVYSDKWDDSRMLDTLRQLRRIRKHQHRYVFLPQAFGPFKNEKNRSSMCEIIKLADCVISRDEQSFAALKPLDSGDKVWCYPDITPLLDVSAVVVPVDLPESFACIIVNYKMVGPRSDAKYAEHREDYLQFLQTVVEMVAATGITPVLLNHEGVKDEKICLSLIERLANKPQFINGLSALEVKKVIGLSVFCLSSRFHGCVSGLSQGVPVLGTSWSHKYEELYRYYQCSDHLIDITAIDELKAKIDSIVAQREPLSEQLLQRAQVHKDTTAQMWQKVLGPIK